VSREVRARRWVALLVLWPGNELAEGIGGNGNPLPGSEGKLCLGWTTPVPGGMNVLPLRWRRCPRNCLRVVDTRASLAWRPSRGFSVLARGRVGRDHTTPTILPQAQARGGRPFTMVS
jgi:hypothetical protein